MKKLSKSYIEAMEWVLNGGKARRKGWRNDLLYITMEEVSWDYLHKDTRCIVTRFKGNTEIGGEFAISRFEDLTANDWELIKE